MKKALKIIRIAIITLLVLIVALVLFGTLFGGCVAQNYVNTHGQDLIGREVQVDHVGLNLFTGRVAIHDLAIMEDNGSDRFAGFDTLDVSVSLLRLLGQTVYLRHITLSGLNVSIVQDSNQMNFQSIIDHFAKDSTEAEPADTTPSNWVVSLHKIHLTHGSADYTDLRRMAHSGFHNLNIFVPDFVIGGKEKTDAGLTVQLTKGGTLKADATWNAQTQDFTADLSLSDLLLDQLKDFNMNPDFVQEIKGALGLTAHVSGNLKQALDMNISGKVDVDNLDLIDSASTSLASLNHLGVDLNKMVLSQNLFDINSIVLDGLNLRYELFADSTNTLSRIFSKAQEVTDTTLAEAEPETVSDSATVDTTLQSIPLQLRLGHIDLNHINFTFADHTLPDPFEFPVTDLRLTADNITTSGNNNAKVFANLPEGGVLLVDWKGNISDWKLNQSLRLDVRNLHLTSLSPYMVAYFALPFTDGIFSFSSLNTIQNSQLNGKNKIDIYKPTLGERRNDVKPQLKLPVKAALYILKDKDDKVILDVPIKGNVDNPEFNYMKLVWKTLGNLVVKVATSPVRMLGNLGGSNDNELFITIDHHEPDFTSEQFYQIDQVAGVAKMDTSYRMLLQLHTRPTDDSIALRNQKIRNKLLQKHLSDLGVPKKQYQIIHLHPSDTVKVEGYSVTLSY
ncbi:MAG: DUF748 domain-containing protein [Bacteroidales bacterium]|nr:DUF748 domain-containing protein [Bacteroidales bacterium]